MNFKQTILILFVFLFCNSCEDDTVNSSIPNLKFSLEVPLINYPDLYAPGNYMVLEEHDSRFSSRRIGYSGVILLHSLYEGEYLCFDRACPKDLIKTTKPDIYYKVKCEKCGTAFDIFTGLPEKADKTGSKEPLKQYTRIAVINGKLTVAN